MCHQFLLVEKIPIVLLSQNEHTVAVAGQSYLNH